MGFRLVGVEDLGVELNGSSDATLETFELALWTKEARATRPYATLLYMI